MDSNPRVLNKGVKQEKRKNSPAPYVRLSNELDEMVREAPTPSERQDMLLWPDSYKLLLPSRFKRKSTYECPDSLYLKKSVII